MTLQVARTSLSSTIASVGLAEDGADVQSRSWRSAVNRPWSGAWKGGGGWSCRTAKEKEYWNELHGQRLVELEWVNARKAKLRRFRRGKSPKVRWRYRQHR